MIRWFWRIYWPLIGMALSVYVMGPGAEARLWPIRGAQSVQVVERTTQRLCWAWSFVKLRAAASADLDAFLVVNGEQGGVVAPFERDTGRPWGQVKYAVPPRAEPYTSVQCIALPPYVAMKDSLRVRQTAHYPGIAGLWTLEVPFPDVVSAPLS